VFRDWIITNDTFVGMDYVMGESCGDINRETKVYFRCSSRTSLSNISEVEKCQYQIQFETPLACFRTAMKVQHLLSEDALIDWRKLDDWYREEDLTSKGLSNHKRSLLQGVGILYKERTIQVKEDKHVPASDSPANTMTTMNCNKVCSYLMYKLGHSSIVAQLSCYVHNYLVWFVLLFFIASRRIR
jgi:N-acetylglucosamine-1-phosphate transferase gamma subunit